jgi:NAD(P)-dependent dehydrogenase (short-subunit alcohol dehydrogenase family)
MSTTAHNILLTGAGSGLGRGLSLYLAQQGHTCLVTDQNLAAAQETAALVTAAGGAPRRMRWTSRPNATLSGSSKRWTGPGWTC